MSVDEVANITTEKQEPELCIGRNSEEKGNQKAFTGFVTAVSLGQDLANTSSSTSSNCSSILANPEEELLIDSTWTKIGPVEIIDIDDKELCNKTYIYVMLSECQGYEKMLRVCTSLGGHFLTEDEESDQFTELAKTVPNTCTTEQIHVSWVGNKDSFKEGLRFQCPTLLNNGSLGSRNCLSELECSICRVPSTLRYTLYGAINNFDRYYFLRMLPDGNIYFEGDDTSNITQEGELWVLRSELHRETWTLRGGSRPVGRLTWYSGVHNITLTLTSCNILQFSSHDGVCLSRSQRCDRRKDSPDGSDEEDCQKRLINMEPNYNPKYSPFHGLAKNGTLLYRFELRGIDKITTKDGVAKISTGILLKWHDARITFIDTKMLTNYIPCDSIWRPSLGVMAGYDIGPEVTLTSTYNDCFVYWTKKVVEKQDFSDPFMGRIMTGRDLNITQYTYFNFEIPCHLKVRRYPFGTYLCNASLYLVRTTAEITMKPDRGEEDVYTVPYWGDRDLLDYRLMNITAIALPDKVVLTLHLTGQFDYHLLNSFAPSALVFLISYSTLFFPIVDFNERIMVSLTSMLVLAGLFAQASGSYVKTPYFKLIDIWYATLIMLCFVVVITNAVVNSLRIKNTGHSKVYPADSDSSLNDKLRLNSKAEVFNMFCKIILLVSFQLLLVLYFLFGTETL
ncbi:uncharacterized protein [Cherax quadricarinatus]|uniref:uncharacterized protein n=1 Tax=Cherax quadricarinatus TaxID=27406 RepID=UPI00387EB51F